jgi:hypothetical protein
MAEAWQKREFEQRVLLEGIMGDALRDAEDGDHDMFFLALGAEMIGIFIAERFAQRGEDTPPFLNLKTGDQIIASYCNGFKARIKDFCRTPEEEHELLARLLTKFTEAGLSDIHGAYLRQMVNEQEKLYEGHSAMDEVPAP